MKLNTEVATKSVQQALRRAVERVEQGEPALVDVENGRQIYVTYGCYQCHHDAAHGGRTGSRLAPRPIAFAAFARYVRAPRNQMPPYTTEIVTDQELADIYAFLLTVPPPPVVESIPILNETRHTCTATP